MSERRPLGLNVAANTITSASLLLTALISVPLMLDEIGLAGYGVWTLAQTLILWTTIAETGVGPAVQRFVAVGHGAGSLSDVRALLWSTCLVYAAVGALIALACLLLAPVIVDVFDVPASLHDDALHAFRIVAGVVWIALLAAGLGNVQQGLERFAALAVSAAVGSVAFLVSVVVFLAAGWGLPGVALAAGVQQGLMLAVRAVDLRSLFGRPLLIHRRHALELGWFSLRLQMTTLSTIVNSQTDKVIVGLVASARTLGQLGIGTQVAEAGRLVAGAALSPIVSRLSITHGAGDAAGLRALFERLHRLWTLLVIGGTVIGAAALYPLIAAWLGDGHGQAVVFGAVLIVAYGVGLMTGTPVAYLRALGQPSLEARLGAVLIGLNVVLTVALGVAAGAVGVVVATGIAHLLATGWFFHRFHASVAPGVGHLPIGLLLRAFGVALLAGAIALGWGVAMVAVLPPGIALGPVALGVAIAGAAYVSFATGIPPTPAGLRRLVLG